MAHQRAVPGGATWGAAPKLAAFLFGALVLLVVIFFLRNH